MTIHVDADYLKDKKTVYPIRIDPTIEINYDNSGESGIRDVTINSLDSSSAANGSAASLFVGKRDGYGISRVLMKFPGLDLDGILNKYLITNAEVELRDLMCETTEMSVRCHIFDGLKWWESSANWTNVHPDSYGAELSRNTISYSRGAQQETAHRYKFDITEAVRGWKVGTYNLEKGIMFKGSETVETNTTFKHKTFASYNRSSYKPSLTITYAVEANFEWEKVEARGMHISGTGRTFTFSPNETATYYIETTRPGQEALQDTKIFLYNSSNELITQNDDKSASDLYSKIRIKLYEDTVYKALIVQASGDISINCYFSVYKEGSLSWPIEQYTICMRNFERIFEDEKSGELLENPIIDDTELLIYKDKEYDFLCLEYAISDSMEDARNQKPLWPDDEYGDEISIDEFDVFFAGKFYERINSFTNNCIIAYGQSNSNITHFAKSKNGDVYSKFGCYEIMKHLGYNAFYETDEYGIPQGFYQKVVPNYQ